MKFQRGLVCTLLMFFLFGLIANAEVSDYPSIQWSKITYTDQTAHTGEVAVSIDGVAGISIVEGQTANIPELPITFIYLFAEVEVWQNEDGSFSVVEDIGDEEVVMTRDELIQNYVEDRIQIIPVVDGATMTIESIGDSGYYSFMTGGYVFIDEEKTIMAREMGQIDSYSDGEPYTFKLRDTATDGMNSFTLDFPVKSMEIDGNTVSYQLLTISEEKAKELLKTLSEAEGEDAWCNLGWRDINSRN